MLRRLRTRLTLLCAFLCGLVVLAISATALYATQAQYLAACAQQNLWLATQLAAQAAGQQSVSRALLQQTEDENGALVALWDNGRQLRWGAHPTGDDSRTQLVQAAAEQARKNGLDPALNGAAGTTEFLLDAQNQQWRCCAVRVPATNGSIAVLVMQPRGPEFAHLARLWLLFCGMGLAGLAAVAALGWVFAGMAIRPVQAAQDRQTQFIAAASHELRGPLAVIRANAEAARLRPGQTANFLGGIDREAARMGRLVDELLVLARMDAGGWQIQAAPVAPDMVVIETADRFFAPAAQKKLRLELQLPDEELPAVQGDSARLQQVLGIFVENALGYAPPGSSILLGARCIDEGVELFCADHGPGMPPAMRQRIFERFYRADAARTDKQHFGLGLSVAAELAAAHSGSILVQDTPGGGATFVLRLPAAKTHG